MNKILILIFSSLYFCFVVSSESVLHIGQATMIYSFCIAILDYLRDKKFRLIHLWCFAFLYIIASEMVLSADLIQRHPYGLRACIYLILGNFLFYFGYLFLFQSASPSSEFSAYKKNIELLKGIALRRNSFYVLIFFSAIFILYAVPQALSTIFVGRITDSAIRSVDSLILDNFVLSVGLVLPALIHQFSGLSQIGKLKRWLLHFICLLIFIIFILLGTRYYVLFCLGGYLIVANKNMLFKVDVRKVLLMVFFVVSMGFVLNAIKDVRVGGLSGDFVASETGGHNDLMVNIASMFSPEGVVKLNADAIDYFERHDHLYGLSSGFLLYFWMPRAIWPEKPKMIGYWLIREYEDGFSDGHSASVGFFGDLYADFYLLVFPILFLLGGLLFKIESVVLKALQGNTTSLVLAAMTYPAIFFFVRSPITTLVNFFGMYLAFKMVTAFLYKPLKSGWRSKKIVR